MDQTPSQPTVGSEEKGFWNSFREFLHQHSVIGLAIGVVVGTAANALVQSLANGVLTPLVSLLIPQGKFQSLVFQFKGVSFNVGGVVSSTIHFLIILLLVYIVVRYFLKQEDLLKKK